MKRHDLSPYAAAFVAAGLPVPDLWITPFAGDEHDTVPEAKSASVSVDQLEEMFRILGKRNAGAPKGSRGYWIAAQLRPADDESLQLASAKLNAGDRKRAKRFGYRSYAHVELISAAVVDYDEHPAEPPDWRPEAWPCGILWHTSHNWCVSHIPRDESQGIPEQGPGKHRVVLPFAEPMPLEEYQARKAALQALLPRGAKLRAPHQPAYWPTCPLGRQVAVGRIDGTPLDWSTLPRAERTQGNAVAPVDDADVPDLSAIPDVHGSHADITYSVGAWLGSRGYPDGKIEAAVEQLPWYDDNPRDVARQALNGAKAGRAGSTTGWRVLGELIGDEARAALEAAVPNIRAEREAEWFRKARGELGVEASDMSRDVTGLRLCAATEWPWIVQSGDQFWLHTQPGAYSNPWRASELIASVARELSGFLPSDVINLKDLRLNWIRPARHVRASYMARAHTYDPETNTMLTAALDWMPYERAQKHEHVDRWLHALWGEDYDAGAQWLASCVALDRPAPLLYMIGEKELGKSLLVDGLAPLWGCIAVPTMASAIHEFNAGAGSCPLAFADEGLPEKLSFERFRSMITEHSREIQRKGIDKTVVEGCARYVVSANNREVLRWQRMGVLTPDDQAAIAARLLVIECRDEARALLAELGKDVIDAMASGQIAEHVLWLASTVELEPSGERMAAKPGGGDVLLESVVDNRHCEVLTFLGRFLEPGSSQIERDRAGVAVTDDQIRVRPAKLGETMRALGSRIKDADVREACRAYAGEPDALAVNGTRYKVLDRKAVAAALARLDA